MESSDNIKDPSRQCFLNKRDQCTAKEGTELEIKRTTCEIYKERRPAYMEDHAEERGLLADEIERGGDIQVPEKMPQRQESVRTGMVQKGPATLEKEKDTESFIDVQESDCCDCCNCAWCFGDIYSNPNLYENMPQTYLAMALAVTIFMNIPLGFVGICCSLSSVAAYKRGDISGAKLRGKMSCAVSLFGVILTMSAVIAWLVWYTGHAKATMGQ